MEENKKRKTYMSIGSARLLNIKVIVDGTEVYEGMVEDAPEEIKKMRYYKIEMSNPMTYYVDTTSEQ